MFCGIDVGIKRCSAAIINDELTFVGNYEDIDFSKVKAAGIDAPLSLPNQGSLRECERILLKMGIRLFPSGALFFRKIVERGIEIAKELRSRGIKVFEVYPYATRVILNIAPREKKNRKDGIKKIVSDLSRYIEVPELNHDEVDAVIAALTVKLYFNKKAIILEGSDGSILIPKAEVQQTLIKWEEQS